MCPFCQKVFSSEEIKAHIALNHLSIENVEHQIKAENSMPIKNEHQEELENQPTESEKETSDKTLKKLVCDQCPKSFSNKSHLRAHVNSVHLGIVHSCSTCKCLV